MGAFLHRRDRNWGATAEEISTALPGDEPAADQAITVTRAVTINAPPAGHRAADFRPEHGSSRGPLSGPLGWGSVLPHRADQRRKLLAQLQRSCHQAGLAGRIAGEVMDPVTLIVTRKMLLGVEERAERHASGLRRP